MQAGLLRDIIVIEKTSVNRNSDGSEVLKWTQRWRGRARVEQSAGSLVINNGETFNTITKKITIRTKPVFDDVPSTLRVVYKGQKYRVLSIDPRITDMATIMIVELINQ